MGAKCEKGWSDVHPQQTRFHFWGSYVCTNFGENRLRNVTLRVETDGHTDGRKPPFYLPHAMCYSYRTDNR